MKPFLKIKLACLWMVLIIFGIQTWAWAEELVRAKIGMEVYVDQESRLAKSKDRIKAGDQLRLYVIPEKNSFIYVVTFDQKHAVLLNPIHSQQRTNKGFMRTFPGIDKRYQPDGTERKEFFTVICSPTELSDITNLFSKGIIERTKWDKLEENLMTKSAISLSEKVDKPFGIAGNVRSANKVPDKAAIPPDKLKIFSGKSLLVKRYEFNVKK